MVFLKWPIKIFRIFVKDSSLKKENPLINWALYKLGQFERVVVPSKISGVTLWSEGTKPK